MLLRAFVIHSPLKKSSGAAPLFVITAVVTTSCSSLRLRFRRAALAALLLCAAVSHTHADDFISGSGTGGTVFNQTFNGTTSVIGWRITVGSLPLAVTSLGTWDSNSDGLPSSIRVGVWDTATAVLLGDVIVPAGTGAELSSGFRFADLTTPVVLLPGTSYTFGQRIVGPNGTQNVLRGATNVPFASTAAAFELYAMNNGGAGESTETDFATQMPTNGLGDTTPILGPNFQFAVVPEPGSLALCAVAGLTLFVIRRRRS